MPYDAAAVGRVIEAHPVLAVGGAVLVGLAIYARSGGSDGVQTLLMGVRPTPKDNVVIGADAGSGVPPETPSATYVSPDMLQNYYKQLEQEIMDQRAALEAEIWRTQAQNYNGGPYYGP